jgi:hypothetical protein
MMIEWFVTPFSRMMYEARIVTPNGVMIRFFETNQEATMWCERKVKQLPKEWRN